jgi:hypothetical protein
MERTPIGPKTGEALRYWFVRAGKPWRYWRLSAQSNYVTIGAMDTCLACGAVLPEGARFCPTCASPVERRLPDELLDLLATA